MPLKHNVSERPMLSSSKYIEVRSSLRKADHGGGFASYSTIERNAQARPPLLRRGASGPGRAARNSLLTCCDDGYAAADDDAQPQPLASPLRVRLGAHRAIVARLALRNDTRVLRPLARQTTTARGIRTRDDMSHSHARSRGSVSPTCRKGFGIGKSSRRCAAELGSSTDYGSGAGALG